MYEIVHLGKGGEADADILEDGYAEHELIHKKDKSNEAH